VLELSIPNEEIIKRLSGRRVCRNCGATSHIIFDKPKVDGVCDNCGGELYQREDDKEEVIANRLSVYSEQTEPIVAFYKNLGILKAISAVGEVSEISANAIAALK
jgi:adenylate kinase